VTEYGINGILWDGSLGGLVVFGGKNEGVSNGRKKTGKSDREPLRFIFMSSCFHVFL
jgi:hypothetical protein